jgi:hypothetical protein
VGWPPLFQVPILLLATLLKKEKFSMKRAAILLLTCFCCIASATYSFSEDHSRKIRVIPFAFDPADTDLVAAKWLSGIGCPTSAGVSTTGGHKPDATYTDPACTTGDDRDKEVEGLLLVKTGPTPNVAAGGATITGVERITLTEIGYDIRKPVAFGDPRGSHCGAGAPRFNVVTQDNVTHFIGCASPPPVQQQVGNGWLRLRWDPAAAFPPIAPNAQVKSISIIFDEGQDTGPDNFGVAIVDNIDINGTLVGKGSNGNGKDDD